MKIINNTIVLSLSIFTMNCSPKKAGKANDYFEGVIKYKHDFIQKTPAYDSATLKILTGTESRVYVKEGNSKAISYGTLTTEILYRKDKNKWYRQKITSDSLYWTDCSLPGQKILKYYKTPKAEKVLEVECDKLTLEYDNRTTKYYYNTNTLKVNPEWHSKFTFLNEHFLSEQMKSLVLKVEIEYKDFIIIQTATNIEQRPVADKTFEIPDKPLAKDG